METQLRKRMEQVKELFTDCTDVFEEIMAVRKHLSEKIEECRTAVENIQSCLRGTDATAEAQIQDLCAELSSQEEQAEAVLKEVGLVSSVASPQVLEELSADCSRLREAIAHTKDMINLKREEEDKGLYKVINDERELFEEWFQDLQLSVNECFESPESRTDVETSVRRLTGFLKSEDTERRLSQLNDQLERARQRLPPEQLSELTDWLKEQQEEVATFRTHCQNRQEQMQSLLDDLNRLQKQHESLCEWLQSKEKQSAVRENVKLLLKELQDESGRAEALRELLASIRRQGVRAENILKDGDNLLQRCRNLEARLQNQVEAQSALEEEYRRFQAQAESTRTWISELTQPLASPDTDGDTEEMKRRTLAILSSRAEGDSKVNILLGAAERLSEQEDVDGGRKHEARLLVREMENQWRTALETAEEALNKAETKAALDKLLGAFQTRTESFEYWIKDQRENLVSAGPHMEVEEKLQVAEAVLSSRPHGESRLQDLKQQCQIICENQASDGNKRTEVCGAVQRAEEQWQNVLKDAEVAVRQAESRAASQREFKAFRSLDESFQSWIREKRHKLLGPGGHMEFDERWQIVQAVMSSRPEGESKLLDLKTQAAGLCKQLEKSGEAEVEQMVTRAEQLWGAFLHTARQAELRSLSDNFDCQSKNTESWIRDRQQKLQSVCTSTPPEERCHIAQAILSSRPDGDFKVNNLRRRGQTLCDHQDVEEGQKVQVQQTVKDTEKQWREVLQAAQQVQASAAAEIAQETERRRLELSELDSHQHDTESWLEDLQQQLASLGNQTEPEDRLHAAQTIMSFKTEGDSKLQKLRSLCQSLCSQDLDKQKKRDIQQRIRDSEEQWTKLQQNAKQAASEAERQHALDLQLRSFQALKESASSWLEARQQALTSLDHEADPEQVIKTAQNILSLKPEGDSKLTELKRQRQNLSEQQEISEAARREAQKASQDSEELWAVVLQAAENTLLKAEVQYSLSRETEAFCNHADDTKRWIEDLQKQADAIQGGTQGSKAQLEKRLKTAQVVLSSKSHGESQVMELKKRAKSLCDHTDLEEDKKVEVKQTAQDVEMQWRTVVQAAEETQRRLQGVMDRLLSCEHNQEQAEARLAEIQKQTSSLPQTFPWPGLGERRQAVEQARTLLDQTTALAPVLSDVRAQADELYEITQDQSWTNASWAAREEAIPALLTQLTDAVANLEQGIATERQCTQLIEQHEAAQDWLREQVKGLGPAPADKHGLHNAVNTLKALLQTVDREQREMTELDSAKECLLSLCTPGGQDAITLEVSHLRELCANSEQEVREHLTTCEMRLEEMDRELARISQELKERAAALQWELRSLDQAFSYSEPQNNIAQLQQHWHSLQNCENSLLDLGVKVHNMYQEVKSATFSSELPPEIVSLVSSLCQQHASLECRLSDHQGACSTKTAHYLKDCISAMQQWSHSKPSDSVSSLQVTLEEGEKLQHNMHEALSHQIFLTACLTPDLFEKFKKECVEMLRHVDIHMASLTQNLKEIEQRGKRLPDTESSDMSHVNLGETKTTVVPPPRKNKRSHEKQSVSLAEKSTSVKDEPSVEEIQIEAHTPELSLKPVMEVSKSVTCEETSPLPSRRKSKRPDTGKEPVHTKVETELGKARTTHCSASSEPETKDEPITSEARSQIVLSKTTEAKSEQNQESFENAPPKVIDVKQDTGLLSDPQFAPEHGDMSLLEQRQVLPPRRKPKSPKIPPKYTEQQIAQTEQTEVSHGEELKPIPIRRKSKTSIPTATSLQIAFEGRSKELKPEHNKTIPDSLESPNVHIESEASETAGSKKDKPSPTKRRSKGQKILVAHTAETFAESHPEPVSEKSLQSSEEQPELFVEETALLPSWQNSKSLEVPITSEPFYSANTTTGVESEKTEQESIKHSATETFTGQNGSTFLPPKRTSKKTELCLVQALQIRDEPEGQPSLQFEQKQNESVAQESSSSDKLIRSTQPSLMEDGKPLPTKRISGGLIPLEDPIVKALQDNLVEPGGQKSSEGTENAILTQTEIIQIQTKSVISDVSAAIQPAPVKTYSLESIETEKELQSENTTDQGEPEHLPTTRSKSPVISPQNLSKEETQGFGSGQKTEGAVVHETQLTGSNSLSFSGPQMATETNETLDDVLSILPKTTEESEYPSCTEQIGIVVPSQPETPSANQEPNNLTEYRERETKSEGQALVAQVDERQGEILVVESTELLSIKGKSEGRKLPLEQLNNNKIPTDEEHDKEFSLSPSMEQTDVNLGETEPKQIRKELGRVEPSAGSESLCAAETNTDVVTKHDTGDCDSVKSTTAVKMLTPKAVNDSVDNQTLAEEISQEDTKVFQDQNQQEKKVATVVLDSGGGFMHTDSGPLYEVETLASPSAEDSETDISASSIMPYKSSDTGVQMSEHIATEALQQTTSQSSERDLDTVSKSQARFSSDSTDVSTALQPDTMAPETGGLETKETKKEFDKPTVFSTPQSHAPTTDQEEYEFLTPAKTEHPIADPEPSNKEKSLDTEASDSQTAEAAAELMHFREQPSLTTSVVNEQCPDITESKTVVKCEETQSQSGEAILTVQEDEGQRVVLELKQIDLTERKSKSPKDFDGTKAAPATEVLTTMTQNDNTDSQAAVEQHSEVGEESEIQLLDDQNQQEKKVATIVLDADVQFMHTSSGPFYEVETLASPCAEDSETDISASSIMPYKTSDTGVQMSEHRATEALQQTTSQSSERDLDTVSKSQARFSSDSTDVSTALQPDTMALETGGLEIKETKKELDKPTVSSTPQSHEPTTDQEEHEFLTPAKTEHSIADPEPSNKEKSLDTKASDSQTAEAAAELMHFREQPKLTTSVVNEQCPDITESKTVVKYDETETQSQSGEAILTAQEDKGQGVVLELKQIPLTKHESKTSKDFDGTKAAPATEVLTTTTQNDNTDSQAAVEQHSEVGEESDIQVQEDQNQQEKKVATIVLDTSEGFMDAANSLPHQVETCAISSPTKELKEDINFIPVTSYKESEHRPQESPQQTITQSSERDLDTPSKVQLSSSSDSTDAPNLADYIEKLWENTDGIERRFLILDVPDTAISQTCEIELNQPDKGSDDKNVSIRSSSAASTYSLSQEGRTELTEIKSSEDENVKLRGTVSEEKESEQETPQERSKGLTESGVQVMLEEGSAQKEPVCILHLEIATSPAVTDGTCVTGHEQSKEPAEAEQISDETKPSASEAVLDHKTEYIEISLYEHEQIGQIETKMANKYTIPEEHPALLTPTDNAKSVTLDESQMLTEVCVLKLDIQSGAEDREITSTQEEKETPKDFAQKQNQSEQIVVIFPEEAAVEMNEMQTQDSSTHSLVNVAEGDSVQLSSLIYESIQPHETRVIEISLNDKDISPRKSEATLELLTAEQERPSLGIAHTVVNDHSEMSTEGLADFYKRLGEKPELGEKPQMEPEEQTATQASAEEHENMFAKEPGIFTREEPQQTDSMGMENESESISSQHTPLPSCDTDTVLENRSATEQGPFKPQVLIQQDMPGTIQERPAEFLLNQKKILPDTLVEQTTSLVTTGEMPNTDLNETSVQGQNVIEKKDLLPLDIYPEDMTMREINVKQQDKEESVEAEHSEKGNKEERQTDPQLDCYRDALAEVDKGPSVTEQPSKPLIPGTDVASETFYEKLVENTELSVNPVEVQTVDNGKQPEMETSMKSDSVKERQDGTIATVQLDESASGKIQEAVLETFTPFLSEPSWVHTVQTDEHPQDGKEKIDGEVREAEERTVSAQLQIQTTSDEVVKHQDVNLSKVFSSAEETLTGSPQVVEKSSSSDVPPEEVTHSQQLSAQEHKTQHSENPHLKESERTAVDSIFTEIQQHSGTGTISQLIEAELQKNVPEDLITPTMDLNLQLSRLASNVLCIKNSPTELNPKAMAQQVEEVQQRSELQLSLLQQLREANAQKKDVLEDLENQWGILAKDTAAVIQIKEAQLQLVADYCRHRETAKKKMDQLNAELEAMKMSPQESSYKEAERLRCFQRTMEENREIIGELLITHAKICLHLSRSDQETAQIEQKNLLENWRSLESTVESSLHHANVHSQHISTVLSDLSSLQERMHPISQDLEVKSSLATQWSCKEAQHLMEANAEIKAVKQQYFHLQQLSKELLHSSQWQSESEEISNRLQEMKNKICFTEELLLSQTKNSSNPIMGKIIAVMRDGLAWAKQTESDIEGRRKWVPLLPEEVHRQLKDLKKLQSEVMAKQGQLESLVEEVTELLPQLDQAQEVPIVHTSLERLEELSNSTTDKLSKAIKEVESGLQIREKLSEQMADLDSWVVGYLQSEVSRSTNSDPMSHGDLDLGVCQAQERLAEAERQAAICEALLMKSKDIAVELSATDNCQLYDKIRKLQEDIRTIISHEKAQKEELDQLIKTVETRKNALASVEKSLRQMSVDVSRLKFPITKESLQVLKPLKLLLLDHKVQVDLLIPWTPQQKLKEMNDAISELHNKIASIEMKSRDQENYLSMKQCLETVEENFQQQVCLTGDDSMDPVGKYKLCHTLLLQFSQMKGLCRQVRSNLELIAADLDPSQLTAEQQRIKHNEDILDTWENTLCNNLGLIELSVLKDLDLESVRSSTDDFLSRTLRECQNPTLLEPNQVMIDREYWRIASLKKAAELQMRSLQVLEQNKGSKQRRRLDELINLKNAVLSECDSKMEDLLKARERLRSYTLAVNTAVQFLQDIEGSLLPLQGSIGPCCERLEETEHALASLQHQFQTYIEKLQDQSVAHTYLSSQKVEQVQEMILSQLLVRMSTLLAKGHIRLENLHRCAEQYSCYQESQDEILKSVARSSDSLLQQISQKVTCLTDCTDQQERLSALSEEMESILKRLENMREWCSEISCRGGREATVATIWRRVSRLRNCMQKLTAHCKQRITDWRDVTSSLEKASAVLETVEAELPNASATAVSTEELQELLQSWEQYQERLDCEHRALSALELRTARLLGVPAHLEQAPPFPLCQRLQLMQGRYSGVGQKSKEGLVSAKLELEEREKVREELQVIHVWLKAAESLLSKMEQSSSTQELQDQD
ncbi:uncharacterized protein LOC118558730 [Fundulus heteroclitus]|uniref:uncharacterized protein LOC118558730 n=1 Tax=Fundulus heteroclitus TaxID=8078 RepID=UPI00165C7570|nr:uncharacterized protein LOC118558730 [Fundulus heteroclitus]